MIYYYLAIFLFLIGLWGLVIRRSYYNMLLNLQLVLVSVSMFFLLIIKNFGETIFFTYSVAILSSVFLVIVVALLIINISFESKDRG